MLDVNVVVWCLVGGLVAAIVVFAVMARGRRALQDEAAAAKSAAAVAESRLADLTTAHAALTDGHRTLNEQHLALSRERERLNTTLEQVSQDLQREATAGAALRGQLEENVRLHSRLESDHRVVVSQNGTLTERGAELEAALQKSDAENRQHAHDLAQLKAQVAALEEKRQGLEARLAEQKAWVEEQTRFFEQKVSNVAAQLLEEKSKAFTEVNRKEIDAVVGPFKEQLKDFRERVDHIYTTDSRDRGALHEQIRQLTELNQVVSRQAEDLTRALTISSKATGDWGEMILHKILEDSGLREGKEYLLQHSVEGAETDVQRPDAVINLPDGKQVVVDSKVSNKAWKEYCSAADDETRALKLAEHLASIRAHIRGLSARDYPRSPDLQTIDFVLMFVPVEAALLTALQEDEALFADAWRAKIYLVSPGMLMASLKLIEGMWLYQRRKESADKIAEAGRKLHDKLTIFANTFVEVGEAIQKAHGTFEKAKGQLATGKGNAIGLAEKMKKLGVTPGAGKVMPAELVELAQGEDEDAEEGVTRDGREHGRGARGRRGPRGPLARLRGEPRGVLHGRGPEGRLIG
jgi:DNA recombination protein RmuC